MRAAARARWIGGEDHASAREAKTAEKFIEFDVFGASKKEMGPKVYARLEAFTTGAIRVRVDERETPRYVPVDVLTKEAEFRRARSMRAQGDETDERFIGD